MPRFDKNKTLTLSDAIKVTRPKSFMVMAKPIGPVCNLNCTYCYYLEKQNLYQNAGSFKMTDEVLESYIRQFIESQEVPVVTFTWQGGEPTLLGLDFFKKAVELQQKYRGSKKIDNAFQTNSVINDANVLKPLEVYRFLKKIGSGYLQFIPIIERRSETTPPDGLTLVHPGYSDPAKPTDWSITARQFGKFMMTIFDEWVRNDVGKIFVQLFDLTLPRQCLMCEVRFACHGGCPKGRIATITDGKPGLNWLCEGYKAFFEHIKPHMDFMANELAHERPPANIMQQPLANNK